MGIPRIARLLIFSTLIITLPTLYFLYPHRDHIIQTTQGYLEKGGIDSSHWRDPIPPGVEKYEHEEVREWDDDQDVLAQTDEVQPETDSLANSGERIATDAPDVLDGGVIMPKLENATAKYARQSYRD